MSCGIGGSPWWMSPAWPSLLATHSYAPFSLAVRPTVTKRSYMHTVPLHSSRRRIGLVNSRLTPLVVRVPRKAPHKSARLLSCRPSTVVRAAAPSGVPAAQCACDLCDVIFAKMICAILLMRTFTLETVYLYTFSVYVPLGGLDEPPVSTPMCSRHPIQTSRWKRGERGAQVTRVDHE